MGVSISVSGKLFLETLGLGNQYPTMDENAAIAIENLLLS